MVQSVWVGGKKKEAEEVFEKAYNLYSLFWALNMGVINLETKET